MNRNSGALTAQIVPALALPAPAIIDQNIASRVAEREWKLAIIAPALVFKKGTKGRAETLRDIADRKHRDIHGKTVTYSIDTLRDWCALVEANDHGNLARPRRRDAGKRRNFVNRIWDKACPLPDTEKLRLADEIRAYLKGLWKECGKGEKKITSLGTTKLLELSLAAGWQGATLDACTVGLHAVRAERNCGLLSIKEKDAKKWFNHFIPRIHRTRPDKPMDIVIGDVHPVDILVLRNDGSEATARMIAWLDLATNDFFYSLVLLPKGKGITQAHITRSFVDLVQAWGLPSCLYFDNGTEYEGCELIDGFRALQGLVEGFHAFMIGASEIDTALGIDKGTLTLRR